MLELDLQKLRHGPVELRERISPDRGPWRDDDIRFAEAPLLEVRATETGEQGVHVTGRLAARLRLQCRRCLEEVMEAVDLDLDLLFVHEVEKGAEPERVYPLATEATTLSLGPALREQLLLAKPPFPLCSEDCAGLCPACGIDRNSASCDCTLREPDPRWDALRELKAE